jgi:adenylate cyclase
MTLSDSMPEAGAIEIQVGRILASKEFDASERNRRFLKHIVEEAVAGRASRIKAYSIATAVFDRGDNFDPQADPIVRIEASRLRRSLERYYLTEGRFDPIRITIPKGSYIPRFEVSRSEEPDAEAPPVPEIEAAENGEAPGPRGAAHSKPAKYLLVLPFMLAVMATWGATAWFNGSSPFSSGAQRTTPAHHEPEIFVAPLETDENLSTHPDLSRGLTREIINGLTHFAGVMVYGAATSVNYSQPADFRKLSSDLGVDYVLTGGMSLSQDSLTLTASLVEASSGRYLWSQKFSGNLTAADAYKIRDDIAAQVVDVVAQPYGVVFNEKAREIAGDPPRFELDAPRLAPGCRPAGAAAPSRTRFAPPAQPLKRGPMANDDASAPP